MRDIDLIRIEHKLDLIIGALQTQGLMFIGGLPSLDEIEQDFCPVCESPVSLTMDLANEAILRNCACRLPISIVPGISKLQEPPEVENHGSHSRTPRAQVSPEQEEGGTGDG